MLLMIESKSLNMLICCPPAFLPSQTLSRQCPQVMAKQLDIILVGLPGGPSHVAHSQGAAGALSRITAAEAVSFTAAATRAPIKKELALWQKAAVKTAGTGIAKPDRAYARCCR